MRYPLELVLRPSRCILTLLAAIHAIAAAAFVFSPMAGEGRGAALAILALSLVNAVWREAGKSRMVLTLRDDGSVACGAGHRVWTARVAPGIADFGWAVWLRLESPQDEPRLPRAARALMLMPDSLRRGDWRGLRIWLRHKAAAAPVRDAGAA